MASWCPKCTQTGAVAGEEGMLQSREAAQAPHLAPNPRLQAFRGTELPSYGLHLTSACPRAWEDTEKRVSNDNQCPTSSSALCAHPGSALCAHPSSMPTRQG